MQIPFFETLLHLHNADSLSGQPDILVQQKTLPYHQGHMHYFAKLHAVPSHEPLTSHSGQHPSNALTASPVFSAFDGCGMFKKKNASSKQPKVCSSSLLFSSIVSCCQFLFLFTSNNF
jgi:hypothetical protein